MNIGMVGYFLHECQNCGRSKSISVNNDGGCIDYCEQCSWKPSEGISYPFNGRAYRAFKFIDSKPIELNPYNERVTS